MISSSTQIREGLTFSTNSIWMYSILWTIPSSLVSSVKDKDGFCGTGIGRSRCSDGSAAVAASDNSEPESDSSLSDSSSSFELANRILGKEALRDWSRRESESSSKLFANMSSSPSDVLAGAAVGVRSLADAGSSIAVASSSQQP